MNDFIQMHVFFFVTTILTVIIGVIVALILLQVWRILRYVERVSKEVSEESALLRQDIAELRMNVKTEGFKLKHMISFFLGTLTRFGGTKGKKDEKKSKA